MKKLLLKTGVGIAIATLAGALYLAHKTEFFKDDSLLYDEFDSTKN